MTDFSEQTLAGIVTTNHKAVTIFEKYNLDFCCKGKRTLQEACQEKSIDVALVTGELKDLSTRPDYKQMPFTDMSAEQLISHILVKHHFYVKQSIPQIQQHLQKVVLKHRERFSYMKDVYELFVGAGEEMTQHMEKEEQVLFPRIKILERSFYEDEKPVIPVDFISIPVLAMEAEHEITGDLLYRIRSLTDNYTAPQGACTTFKVSLAELKEFEEDLHQHVHLENNILFPKAISRERELVEKK